MVGAAINGFGHDRAMHWTDIARRQAGVIRRGQLAVAGLSRDQIGHLLRRRVLTRTAYRGVYRVAGAPRSPDSEAWAAVLGADAVLSHLSAAQWWDIPVEPDGMLHVVRRDRRRFTDVPGIRVHRTLLEPWAITTRFGLDLTTRVETLLDCLGWLPRSRARSLLDRAFQQAWLRPADIERRLDVQPGRWGNRALATLLRESQPGAEAESERRAQRLLRRAGICGWVGNLSLVLAGERFRVDIAFPDLKIAIEIDGWAFHRSKERRDRDNRKRNLLGRAGWIVLTFTWEDVVHHPDYFVDEVMSVVASRAAI
jgi:very-short-patch-repair endonuclease